ncbi:stonustoxin subunit beta-like isoform X1 [Scleropages formosus]|uniref:stonustoxin subunit beta-like isoform X1 n=2 Tax=Scleropages formosus TaxID=113540 RepID=UPI0008787E51|nr:stonustoxin subunit beta-like isoform X1 [Scleropages formosus]
MCRESPKMEPLCIQIAALGRPLYPGMLYDCRSDSFIPGVTLWNRESLNKDLDTHVKPHTSFNVTTSDTINEKAKLLEISGSLKASILGGIVEIGGSAKYLNDKASSLHQSRVTMQYGHTVRFEQLTMTHLSKVTYPQVFEQRSATHVVTAVLYGAQAFFVFNSTNFSKEDKTQIEGKLKMVLNNIKNLSGQIGGELNLTENEQELVSGFTCTFHGDFELQHNPTNFTEAVEVYRTLPERLGNKGEKAVPLRVWLYPLRCLDSKAAQMMREIDETLVSRLQSVLEELEDVILSCNDLMAESILQLFPEVHDKIKEFYSSLLQYRVLFQKNLSSVLSAVRGGGKEEQDLESILESHKRSPFSSDKLKKWFGLKRSETSVLVKYTKPLKESHILFSSHLEEVLLDPEIDTTICFTFTSLAYSEPYLSTLSTYLNSDHNEDQSAINEENVQPWFRSDQCSSAMRENLKLFTSFAEANQHRERIKFVSAAISDPEHPGASIRLYQQAQLVDPKYIPVPKPKSAIVEDIQCSSATLRLFMSSENVRYYRVEYRKKLKEAESGAEGIEEWTVTDTVDLQETWTISGLQPSVTYVFRYRAVSDVGVGEASEVTEFHTKPVPLRRSELQKYKVSLSLDMNTAHESLNIDYLDFLRTCSRRNDVFKRPSHPGRFSEVPQVLCSESLSDSCFYWEVDWVGGGFCMGVVYGSINRKSAGNDCLLGLNDKSWCICSLDGTYTSVWHDNKGEYIMKQCGDRLGIYLDWPAGTVTFYSVSSDELVHLHTFHSTFTEPLYPAFYIGKGCTIDFPLDFKCRQQ